MLEQGGTIRVLRGITSQRNLDEALFVKLVHFVVQLDVDGVCQALLQEPLIEFPFVQVCMDAFWSGDYSVALSVVEIFEAVLLCEQFRDVQIFEILLTGNTDAKNYIPGFLRWNRPLRQRFPNTLQACESE